MSLRGAEEGREQKRRERGGGARGRCDEKKGCEWQRMSGREGRGKDRKGKEEGDRRERKRWKGLETVTAWLQIDLCIHMYTHHRNTLLAHTYVLYHFRIAIDTMYIP